MCSRAKLRQVTTFLDGAHEANRSLQRKFDVEKKNHEVHLHELQLAYSMLSARYLECFDTQDEVQMLEVEVGR